MKIDIAELRKFQDFWGPVLGTIPAVIEMVERKADLDRSVESAKREYDKVNAHIEKQLQIGTEQIDAAVVRLQEVEATRAQVLLEITAAKSKAAEAAALEQAARQEELKAVNAKITEASGRLKKVDKEYATKLAQKQADHDKAVAAMAAEVAELEARKEEVRAVIDSLKAKLG